LEITSNQRLKPIKDIAGKRNLNSTDLNELANSIFDFKIVRDGQIMNEHFLSNIVLKEWTPTSMSVGFEFV